MEPYVGQHMREAVKKLKGKFSFQNVAFEFTELTGKYDYIMAFNSLTSGNKKSYKAVFRYISKHSKKGAVFAFTMFGPTHSSCKSKTCFSMSRGSITALMKEISFDILRLERRQFDRPHKNDHRDEFEVIASKK